MLSELSDIDILYEDNHLIAVNKPAGLMTQPSGTAADNLEDRTKRFIKETRNKPGKVFLHAVHRLDKVAGGIVLFARTDKALSRMNEKMREHVIVRVYHAVITGKLASEQGKLVHYLRHSRLRSLPAGKNDPGAREAVLSYRVLGRKARHALVEIILETGRYHQIRAQLSASGCPILGDKLYGSSESYAENAIALHHKKMEFMHPVRNDHILIEAAYPDKWPW